MKISFDNRHHHRQTLQGLFKYVSVNVNFIISIRYNISYKILQECLRVL